MWINGGCPWTADAVPPRRITCPPPAWFFHRPPAGTLPARKDGEEFTPQLRLDPVACSRPLFCHGSARFLFKNLAEGSKSCSGCRIGGVLQDLQIDFLHRGRKTGCRVCRYIHRPCMCATSLYRRKSRYLTYAKALESRLFLLTFLGRIIIELRRRIHDFSSSMNPRSRKTHRGRPD